MNRETSIYLDLLRFVAAMAVFLAHASYARYTALLTEDLGPLGHDAVIVFFVISGYVIAYVSARKEQSFQDYALSRAARIYSVAIPAIVLTIALECARVRLVPTLHEYQLHKLWLYVPFWSVFGTDWWFLNENMLSNSPFWSLSYEVWYYVIFGALFYFRGWRRLLYAGIALVTIGPRQWLLFPIWLAGCVLYYRHERWPVRRGTARCLFFGSIVVYALLKGIHGFDAINAAVNQLFAELPQRYLRYSQFFVGDYLIGALVIVNILSARYCQFAFLTSATKPIRLTASFTFSLYLFHMPLLEFYALVLHTNADSLGAYALLLGSVLASVAVLGMLTEWRKATLRRWLEASLLHVRGMIGRLLSARKCPGA